MTEEARAAEYRAMLERRKANDIAREQALRGSPSAFVALKAAWQPLIDYLNERSTRG